MTDTITGHVAGLHTHTVADTLRYHQLMVTEGAERLQDYRVEPLPDGGKLHIILLVEGPAEPMVDVTVLTTDDDTAMANACHSLCPEAGVAGAGCPACQQDAGAGSEHRPGDWAPSSSMDYTRTPY
jgi:hypothetical protein